MRSRLLPLRRSAVFLTALGLVLPVALVAIGGRVGMPVFVFEHLMVLLVVVLAVAGGWTPAIVAAVSGTVGDNLLLRDPIGRPAVSGMRDLVDLALFLTVAMIVGWLVDRLRSARARAEDAAARERHAREDRDRLVATLTHDLATPLGAIQGTIQFVRRHADVSKVDVDRLLVRVETAAARATSLVRALSDARSVEQHALTLDRRPLDVCAIVEPIVRMMDHTSDRHPIALAIEDAPLVVHGDAPRLERVIENLISNAIKYSPGGGAVEVRVAREDSCVSLSVRDHGIGIPPDARDRVFEIGYRAPHAARVAPGLGLGLYTTLEVIRQHGGTITSAPGDSGGTVFTVRLPLAKAHEVNVGAPGRDGGEAQPQVHERVGSVAAPRREGPATWR